MRPLRMTTRRWMVAVVIIGLMLGGVRLKHRQSRLLSRAQYHEQRAAFLPKLESRARIICAEYPAQIAGLEKLRRYGGPVRFRLEHFKVQLDRSREDLVRLPKKIAYHAAMAHKYEHAARYPWLPVEPDPPEPE
jgi:hypothetical protein